MAEFIKQSLLFPFIQATHLVGLAMLVGTIAILDIRLLGVALRRYTLADLAAGLARWTIVGLAVVAVTGPLMFWSDMPRYLRNPAFVVKMVLLALTLAGHFTIHRRVVSSSSVFPSWQQKAAAALSLALWSSVLMAGRAIADFDPPL
jgi:hypothetical protein